jgi:hypothetical protein
MSVGKKKQADREPSRLLLSLVGRLERYMARAGLIAFAVEGGGDAAAGDSGDTLMGGDAAAGGDAKPGDKPAEGAANGGVKPEGEKPAGDAKPDAKAEGEKPAGDKPVDKKPDDKPTGAPEKYEDFKLPEGLKADTPVMGKFASLAKELNLPQDAAQKVVDLAGELQQANLQELQTVIEAQREKWGTESKTDKEFGGDKFDENLAVAVKARDQFGTPELKSLLNASGLGNHPEVIRLFYRVGQAISQDGFVPGRNGGAQPPAAQRMYANSNMNP